MNLKKLISLVLVFSLALNIGPSLASEKTIDSKVSLENVENDLLEKGKFF